MQVLNCQTDPRLCGLTQGQGGRGSVMTGSPIVRTLPKQPGLGLSLQAGPSGALFGGITIDIQTKEQTKRNKTTIYMKSGHMTGGCVKVRDRRDQEDVEFSKSAMS